MFVGVDIEVEEPNVIIEELPSSLLNKSRYSAVYSTAPVPLTLVTTALSVGIVAVVIITENELSHTQNKYVVPLTRFHL